MIYDIQKKKPAFNIKEGIFYNDIEGYSLKVGEKNIDGKRLKDIIIYDHTLSMENEKVIIAKKGKMNLTKDDNFLELKLFDGHSYIDVNENSKKGKTTYRRTYFKENLIRFDLSNFNILNNSQKLYKGHYAMLNNYAAKNAIDSLTKELILQKSELNIILLIKKLSTINLMVIKYQTKNNRKSIKIIIIKNQYVLQLIN